MKHTDPRLHQDILDSIADTLRKDALPTEDKQQQWNKQFEQRCMALIEMFDDGPEVIVQCKVADQLTRMFEKMRDNVAAAGVRKKWERRDAMRSDVGIEITQQQIEKLDEQISMMRSQYYILNQAYATCRWKVRQRTISQTGMNWGEYTPMSNFAKVKRAQFAKGQLTIENYEAHKDDFWSYARESGLVELPADEQESHAM